MPGWPRWRRARGGRGADHTGSLRLGLLLFRWLQSGAAQTGNRVADTPHSNRWPAAYKKHGPKALCPLPASTPRESATAAPKTMRFPGDPFHAAGLWSPSAQRLPLNRRASSQGCSTSISSGLGTMPLPELGHDLAHSQPTARWLAGSRSVMGKVAHYNPAADGSRCIRSSVSSRDSPARKGRSTEVCNVAPGRMRGRRKTAGIIGRRHPIIACHGQRHSRRLATPGSSLSQVRGRAISVQRG